MLSIAPFFMPLIQAVFHIGVSLLSYNLKIEIMTQGEFIRLQAQIAVLKEVAKEYSGKTIDNIIQQMEEKAKEGAV